MTGQSVRSKLAHFFSRKNENDFKDWRGSRTAGTDRLPATARR
jgi:hypothetical protein